MQGAGFRVQGAGCRVQSARFRVQGSGCRVQGSGCRVYPALVDSREVKPDEVCLLCRRGAQEHALT